MDDDLQLSFAEKIDLMKLVMELREPRPIGVVGLIEARDMLARLFPVFDDIRDRELDDALERLASEPSNLEPPPRSPDAEERPS